jgi:hypothetical protein
MTKINYRKHYAEAKNAGQKARAEQPDLTNADVRRLADNYSAFYMMHPGLIAVKRLDGFIDGAGLKCQECGSTTNVRVIVHLQGNEPDLYLCANCKTPAAGKPKSILHETK